MQQSIIIPNYNGARTIYRVIERIVEEAPQDTEILLIDDCSSDSSVEIVLENFPGVRMIRNQTNRSVAATRNIGFQETSGDWLLFVDSDVILQSGCIQAMLAQIGTADILFPFVCYPNRDPMYPVNSLQASYLMISPVFIIRRAALKLMASPYFDETFGIYCEDTDFFLRAYLAGLISRYCPSAEAIHDVNMEVRNREFRYFLELRNAIYGAIKFRGVKGIGQFDHAFKASNILKVLVCGLFNFNLFDMQARGYRKYSGSRYEMRLLLSRHESLTPRGSLALFGLAIKAFLWNIQNLHLSIKARNSINSNLSEFTG